MKENNLALKMSSRIAELS